MSIYDEHLVCIDCRLTGAIHCHDPFNCGGPWDTHNEQESEEQEEQEL